MIYALCCLNLGKPVIALPACLACLSPSNYIVKKVSRHCISGGWFKNYSNSTKAAIHD
jgi:hypothetical protein